MSRNFDDVTVKDKKKEATIIFTQRDFDSSKHTAEASVNGSTLTVKATIGDKIYQRVIGDVDVQAGPKVQPGRKHVSVTVTKNTEFNMKDKL